MGAVVGTMYLFWFIESLMAILGSKHSHSHDLDRVQTSNQSTIPKNTSIRNGYTITINSNPGFS